MTSASTPAVRLLDRVPGFVAEWLPSSGRATRLLRPLVNAILPDHEVAIRVRSGVGTGLKLPILARSEKYYWTGVHERHVQEALAGLLRPGMTFWDVGAHIGFFSLLASRFVTESGRVEAFEPFKPNEIRLAKAIELNGATNVSIHALALTDATGTRSFHPSSSSLMGSLVSNESNRPVPVNCVSADDASKTIQPPDVMKIDAEGAELDVLRGASGMLATIRPTVLIELTSADMLTEVCALTPHHRCRNIGANHWLLDSELTVSRPT